MKALYLLFLGAFIMSPRRRYNNDSERWNSGAERRTTCTLWGRSQNSFIFPTSRKIRVRTDIRNFGRRTCIWITFPSRCWYRLHNLSHLIETVRLCQERSGNLFFASFSSREIYKRWAGNAIYFLQFTVLCVFSGKYEVMISCTYVTGKISFHYKFF